MTHPNDAIAPADASTSAPVPEASAPTNGTRAEHASAAAPLTSPDHTRAPIDWPLPLLHPDSATLRFWVAMPDAPAVGAVISQATLHHRFGAALDGSNAVATYQTNQALIDDAVRRRVARGSIEPVMLREADLPAPPRR